MSIIANFSFDKDLLRRYDKSGPRYTSYPTAVQFRDSFTEYDYRKAASESNQVSGKALSLYFHIPFCATLCFYCACSKVVTKNKKRADEYLNSLYKEIEMQSDLYDSNRPVQQLHLGGGTPTFLSMTQIEELLETTGRYFNLSTDEKRDFSIEIDPRTVDAKSLKQLFNLGFSRLSLGVQDFDSDVQKAVHRIQPQEETLKLIQAAKQIGFGSINVDLIYGLPLQSIDTFARTLDTIIEAEPDRLSVFNYAHLPDMFAPQQRIKQQELPTADEKMNMLHMTVQKLNESGYVYIGMDHFARNDDSLVKARDCKTLYRNFQGYSSHADCDLVGMGVTSISKVANCYSQNFKTLTEYYEQISKHKLPVTRGVELSAEDRLRRGVIDSLMCYGEIEFGGFERQYGFKFAEYFSAELENLQNMQADGLVNLENDRLTIAPQGRFLIRNVSMIFDTYLQNGSNSQRFSRLI